jgi:hypothetical protein
MHVGTYIYVALIYRYNKESKRLFVIRNVILRLRIYVDEHAPMYHKIPLNYVSSANSVPDSSRKHGKQQVFLQTLSEPPAAIQPKQHAFARELMQQPHFFAVAELTATLKAMSRHMSTAPVVLRLFLASIAIIPGVVAAAALFLLELDRCSNLLSGDVAAACNL